MSEPLAPGRTITASVVARAALFTFFCALVAFAAFALLAAGRSNASHLNSPASGHIPLILDEPRVAYDLWPFTRVRIDREKALTAAKVATELPQFETPTGAHATLGMGLQSAWLHVPILVPADDDGRWIIELDYTLLPVMDVYASKRTPVPQAVGSEVGKPAFTLSPPELLVRLGLGVPRAERSLKTRNHAAELKFTPGQTYDLFFHVQTEGAMILPLTLSKFANFHTRALDEQKLQGLFSTVLLFLLFYSALQWLSLRETLYLKYSLLLLGSGVFSVHFFGIGAQYVWSDSLWAGNHLAGVTSLVASAATALFIEDVLGSDLRPTARLALKLIAWFMLGFAALHALDLVSIIAVGVIMSSVGLLPALLGLPGAYQRIRRGDTVGWYFLVAWLLYFVVSAVMVSVVKGKLGVNFWSMHAFQFGAAADMLIFLRIAVMRTNARHEAAQRAAMERDALHSLAHSDPLTGLLNRRGLQTALAATIARASSDNLAALYLIDLDRFKPVNDRYGHDVGDELLVAVSHRLRHGMRAGDAVARLGGDEFVVLVSGIRDVEHAAEVGQKLLGCFAAPFQLREQVVEVGATIGYVVSPIDGTDAANLLKSADAAMYQGKSDEGSKLSRGHALRGL